MSDFLISIGKAWRGDALLNLLRQPYGLRFPGGQAFDYSWGSVAVLYEQTLAGRNVHHNGPSVVAAVGDLVTGDFSTLADELLKVKNLLFQQDEASNNSGETNGCLGRLNGTFGIVLADTKGPAVITDPLGGLQIYVYRTGNGQITALGTHPDLVARVGSETLEIDPVSVFEFLNLGTPCFPHTMHTRVNELSPGQLHVLRWDAAGSDRFKSVAYWKFPDEFEESPPEEELAGCLRSALLQAVEERTRNGKVGITLSGGLDSRLLMAAVPKERPCVGFTFCDGMNREARIARMVARCYERPWVPLVRHSDYVAQIAVDTIRFIGCECEWEHAHGIGFVEELHRQGVEVLLHGLGMNNNFKLWHAADVKRNARLRGLLPASYEMTSFDYVNALQPFRPEIFTNGLLEPARERRRNYLKKHPGMRRQSKAEWLEAYPTSQGADNAFWIAERRLLPIRMVALDRRLLDIACRVPALAKVENRLFVRMAGPVYGRGARIPNANDGVPPGTGHLARLMYRGFRKTQNAGRKMLASLGLNTSVPHSWHDYQRYWAESPLLESLRHEHGDNLKEFEGLVFASNPMDLLFRRDVPWKIGSRVLQLAIWRSLLKTYAAQPLARVEPEPELRAVQKN